MKLSKYDSTDERRVLTAMIVDSIVLGTIVDRFKQKEISFPSKWGSLVASWCVKYYTQYNEAPKSNVVSLFESWASKAKDSETVALVERFLSKLSNDYETLAKESNSDYHIDLAAMFFNKVRLSSLVETLDGDLQSNEVTDALKRLNDFSKIEMGVGSTVDVFQDKDALEKAFNRQSDVLIQYPDALGSFFGDSLERDGFISFMAPEKRGKCVSGDMLVQLGDGTVKTVRELVRDKIPIKVMSYNESTHKIEPQQVSQFWENGDKSCIGVTTKTGRYVETTENHKYLTPDGWKEIKDIRPGDFVAVPKRVDCFGNVWADANLVRFASYMLAEGGCTGTAMTWTNTDPELIKNFTEVCDAFGITYTPTDQEITLRLSGANPVCRELDFYGKSCKEKLIPEWLFQAPKEQVSDFLRIFFSCDGSIYKTSAGYSVEVGLANRLLIDQIHTLLLRFGIVSKKSKKRCRRDGKVFHAWNLVIRSQETVRLFLSEINFVGVKYTDPSLIAEHAKSFLDRIPPKTLLRFYESLCDEVSLIENRQGKGGYARKSSGVSQRYGKGFQRSIKEALRLNRPMMRQGVCLASGTDSHTLYIEDHILWDEVMSIEFVGVKDTYDLTVPGNANFMCNDFIVHNTFWLMDLAFRAVLQRRRTAFFAVGDMSQDQMLRRFAVRAAKRPLKPGTIKVPTQLIVDSDSEMADPIFDQKVYKDPMDWQRAWKAFQKACETKIKSNESYLKMSVHPNSSIDVAGIKNIISGWVRRGWTPDVIVIDYADILAAPSGSGDESRQQTNATWKQLRSLSQSLHCLVVTATQSDADSYKATTLRRSNFSEDKRKIAHVTGMLGINATEQEQELGIYRLNWIALRESKYAESKCVYTAGCLDIANPAIQSSF